MTALKNFSWVVIGEGLPDETVQVKCPLSSKYVPIQRFFKLQIGVSLQTVSHIRS